MRLFSVIAFMFICFSASAQTFNFTPQKLGGSSTYSPPTAEVLADNYWLTPTDETFDPGDGVERMLLEKDGKPVLHVRGKYFVYMGSLESPGTITFKGKDYPAYPASKGGKYIIFLEGANGLYAKYLSN